MSRSLPWKRLVLLACLGFAALPTLSYGDTVTFNPRIFPLGKWADGMAFDGSSLWVAESGQRTIAQLNSDNTIARRITVGRLPTKMTFANDGAIYTLVETDNLIWQQFPNQRQGRSIGGLDGGCPVYLASGDRYLWGLSNCGQQPARLTRIDPQSGNRSSINLNAGATQMTVSQGRVWVNTRGMPSVVDEQSLAVRTVPVSLGIAVNLGPFTDNGKTVFEGTQGAGNNHLVLAFDPATLKETRRQAVDQQIAVMTSDEKNVVAIGLSGRIFVLSADGLALQRVINLPLPNVDPRAALILGDDLYITSNQQQGENGALLVLSGWRPAAAAKPAPAAGGIADCPYRLVNLGDATGIWMYQDPDVSAGKVLSIPAGSRGLVADRCLTGWCRVTFHGASGWVERSRIEPNCPP